MSINSEETFNRVMIEGGYENIESCDKTIYYGIHNRDISNDFQFDELVTYIKLTGEFIFRFGENKNYDYSFYDEIINTIKKNCSFYDTLKNDEWTHDCICYSCSESTNVGKFGYCLTDSISELLYIIPKEEE